MEENKRKSDPKLTGEHIKARRKELHMSQSELADEVGGSMTNRSISLYERGEREMGLQTFFDIAEALETTPDALVPERLKEKKRDDTRLDKIDEAFASLDEATKALGRHRITAKKSPRYSRKVQIAWRNRRSILQRHNKSSRQA